jgi:RNA polymerase sigma-70 factor (ECF subfamily)
MAVIWRTLRGAEPEVGAGGEPELPVSDADLVAAAQRDPAAFAQLWERYFDPVFRYCRYRLASFEDAEDAANDVFADAFAGIRGYREDAASFRSWLFAIAHNEIVTRHRRGRLRQFLPFPDLLGHAAPGLTTEEAALLGEEWARAVHLLGRLPEEQRRVLELRWSGLTGAEIAGVLGKRHDAVRKIQSRAEARLRTLRDEETRHEP